MSGSSEILEKTLNNLGVATANLLFPRDFECYMVAFELCSGNGDTLDYFTFPIMPSSINIQENQIVKIQNTFGGVSVLSSDLYNPKKISLKGNFGRNIKLLNRGKNSLSWAAGFYKSTETERSYGQNTDPTTTRELSSMIKTGYGCTKVLQSVINRSYGVDKVTGAVNKLYFYNLAFGESYLVKCDSANFGQSLASNMIWEYDLSLVAVCPLHLDPSGKSSKGNKAKVFGMSNLQQSTNALIKSLI